MTVTRGSALSHSQKRLKMSSRTINSNKRHVTSLPHLHFDVMWCDPFYFAQDREKKVSKLEQSGKTEEELLEEQERLFAESRAKFESQQQ
jgi:tRNA1(Val) A37 N6-methylase TrmN6